MVVYVLSMMSIHDAETYKKYTAKTPPIVAGYGGKFLARGGEVTTLEGETYKDRMVILEFPSQQSVHDWLADPEYQKISEFRHASSKVRILMIEADENTLNPDAKL